jgi:hypothetical protein
VDADASEATVAEIDQAYKDGDTLGGVVEVLASGVPVELGSHVHWDRRLDSRLAAALMGIPRNLATSGFRGRCAVCRRRLSAAQSARFRGTYRGRTPVEARFRPVPAGLRPLRREDPIHLQGQQYAA